MVKQTQRNWKTAFNVFAGVFFKSVFFISSVFIVLALWAKCSEPSVSKSRKSCENRNLRVRKITFLVELLKYPQIFIFSVLTAKNSLLELLGRLVKNALVLTTVTFWGKLFLWSFVFFCFWDIEWIFLCLMAKEAYGFVKTSFYVFRRTFTSLLRLKNAQMFNFSYLRQKRICRNFLADLSIVCLYCPQ